MADFSKQPYNDLPLLPPKVGVGQSPRCLRACIRAARALGELRRSVEVLPQPALLPQIMPLLEAQTSSVIENIVTTRDDLFAHDAAQTLAATPETLAAWNARDAISKGWASLEQTPLSRRTAEEVCSCIIGRPMSLRRVTGTHLRDGAGNIVYTPPVGFHRIADFLTNWQEFLHQDISEMDPLIKMAIAHYQFEAIHPFLDGNGRTGRVLNVLYLISSGIIDSPILYLSRWFSRHKAEYYTRLTAVTEHAAWDEWIIFVLQGIEDTSIWTSALIMRIQDAIKRVLERLDLCGLKKHRRALADCLFKHPYAQIETICEALSIRPQAASIILAKLEKGSLVTRRRKGRYHFFINQELMQLLEEQG